MLQPNKDGLLHLRDSHIDPSHAKRLVTLGYLAASDLTNEMAVIAAVERFIADATFRLVEEQNEHPKPIKLHPKHDFADGLQRGGWLHPNDAYNPEAIAKGTMDLLEYAVEKRLDIDDAERDRALTRLVEEQRGKARNAPVTGYAAKAHAGMQELFAKQAAG